jgi:hypothetical protein
MCPPDGDGSFWERHHSQSKELTTVVNTSTIAPYYKDRHDQAGQLLAPHQRLAASGAELSADRAQGHHARNASSTLRNARTGDQTVGNILRRYTSTTQ